jgi:thiol-disulfide isomerase/thioredoxin
MIRMGWQPPGRLAAAALAMAMLPAAMLGACSGQSVPSGGASGVPHLNTTRGGASFLPGPLAAGASIAPGDPAAPTAPDFTLSLLDGTSITASKLWADRPLVLDFFATYCTACVAAQADLNQLAQDFRGRVAFLGVTGSQDTPDTVGTYLDKYAVPYAVALDTHQTAWLRYAVHEPPLVALVSKDGHLLRGWPNGVDAATLRQALTELVGTP